MKLTSDYFVACGFLIGMIATLVVIAILLGWSISHPSWQEQHDCIRAGYDRAVYAFPMGNEVLCTKTVRWTDVDGRENNE